MHDCVVFFEQKTAYEMRISDWSSDVCSSDLPPTAGQGARRVWSDSRGRIWVSEWKSGQVSVFAPAGGGWRSWRLPGEAPRAYAVSVDGDDAVWLNDFGANASVRFDLPIETVTSFPSEHPDATVRQLIGGGGRVWGGESWT